MQAGFGLHEKSDENVYGAGAFSAAGSRFKPGRRSVSIFVEKFVVEYGRCQLVRVLSLVNRVFGTNPAALAKDTTVLLSRDFFAHLEDQFHQRSRRQLLRGVNQDA